jgi:hypothetical protein
MNSTPSGIASAWIREISSERTKSTSIRTLTGLDSKHRSLSNHSFLDVNSDNDWVTSVEDTVRKNTETARENGNVLELLTLRLFVLLIHQQKNFELQQSTSR